MRVKFDTITIYNIIFLSRTFLRALDNAFYNKKKSKNGVKTPFGCAIAVDTTVPEESLANCAFSTSTGITETVQKTCDDLTGKILKFI